MTTKCVRIKLCTGLVKSHVVNKRDIRYGNTLNLVWWQERRIENFGEETRKKETTWEKKLLMGK